MNKRNGLFYSKIINKIKYLERKDQKLYIQFLNIVDRYQNKHNKSIF